MSQKVNVTRHYTIQFDGDIEAYVKCADILSKATGMGELDSYDAGDATGFWMTAYHMEAAGAPDFDGTFIFRSDDPKLLVTVVADDDLFEWDPPL